MDNEILMITTFPLIDKVVRDHGFNYYYYNEGNFRRSEIYRNCPFTVIASKWADSSASFNIRIKDLTQSGGKIEVLGGGKSTILESHPFVWEQENLIRAINSVCI